MIGRRTVVFFGLACGALTIPAAAQRSPYTSPPADVAATIGGKQISVAYSAPSMHGRKIMGALVPYGQVWCTGANWATKITTEANLDIGGLKVPKGSCFSRAISSGCQGLAVRWNSVRITCADAVPNAAAHSKAPTIFKVRALF